MSLTRRRFIAISAAAIATSNDVVKANEIKTWNGLALGADASISIEGSGKNTDLALKAAVDTVSRMEKLFSIYDPGSMLSEFNRIGQLRASPEFMRLTGISHTLNKTTTGLFDPTVQPLFEELTQHRADPAKLEPLAAKFVGWQHVDWGASTISFKRQGMKLTFNGIAQGFATDRVSEVLSAYGFENVTVNIGEYRIGGKMAELTVVNTDNQPLKSIPTQNSAMATTSAFGFTFEDGSTHLIRPDGKRTKPHWKTISVRANTAALADGYSTALGLTTDTNLAHQLISSKAIDYVLFEDMDGYLTEV